MKTTKLLGMSLVLGLMMTTAAFARNDNPGVIPPEAAAFGKTYGEWSAAFWQWLYSLPVDQHPLFDTADCSAGQSGKVWFIGGTFTLNPDPENPDTGVIGEAERTCTI